MNMPVPEQAREIFLSQKPVEILTGWIKYIQRLNQWYISSWTNLEEILQFATKH